ncbi:putative phosphatidylinositol transporter [Aspergillus unguis]
MATTAAPASKYDDYDFPTTAPEAREGHPGHTTPEQDAKVEQLRSELEKEGYEKRLDTLTLLRFLRARKFDVALAKAMFIDTEKWRKDFGTDDLARDFVYHEKAEIFKYYPQYYHKTDKDGRPVYIEKLGDIDLTAMSKITNDDRMLKNLVTEYEKLADPRLPACSRKAGKLLETCCSIIDLKGVSLFKAPSVYGYLKRTSGVSQNYYPERLGKLYLINAPWGFSGVFNVVKGYLDPVTVEKIHVLSSSYQTELLKQVPAENLPVQYGGTCKCEGGCEYSDMGPWREPEWAKEPKWAAPKEDKDVVQTEEANVEKKPEAQEASEPSEPVA